MKGSLRTIFIFGICLQFAFAQTYPLSQRPDPCSLPANSYIKDTAHDFDKFVGTWKSEVDGKVLTITIKKREMIYNSRCHVYTDILGGEYSYSVNGVELVNTMSNLNRAVGTYDHNIAGKLFLRPQNFPVCANCLEGFRDRVDLTFRDPERPDTSGNIVLHYVNELENVRLEGTIYTESILVYTDNQPFNLRVPTGNYVLIKQP